jgi:hypothetical protein
MLPTSGIYHDVAMPNNLEHDGFTLRRILTVKIEVVRSSETSVHITKTRRCIPEDGTNCNSWKELKFYKNMFV